MKRHFCWLWSAILLLFVLPLLSGCSGKVQAEDTMVSVVANVATSGHSFSVNILENKAILRQAQMDLQNLPEFSGGSVQVFEKIAFFDGTRPRIELAVQNPRQLDSLVFYTFENGHWAASEAQDISHIKQLSHHLFALSSVDFTAVAHCAILWRQHARQVNAVLDEPYHVAFVYLPKQNKRFWHTAILEAVGAQYYLSFHEDGRIWEFNHLQEQTEREQ